MAGCFKKGQKFNNLEVVGERIKIKGRYYEKVLCVCGNTKYVRSEYVTKTISCGCLRKNMFGLKTKEYEKLYSLWSNMIRRCCNPSSERYYTYGKRGISVCEEWKNNFHSFAKWCLENGWKPNLSIDRIDVNGNYEPNNCSFITMSEQARNKTNNVLITHNGETKCVAEWAEKTGIDAKVIYARLYRGKTDPEEILYPGSLRDLRKVGG